MHGKPSKINEKWHLRLKYKRDIVEIMQEYLLSRKRVDELIIQWEKDYRKGKTKMSLEMFICRQAERNLVTAFTGKGYSPEVANGMIKFLGELLT
jgi:hypothetical protein